MISHLEIQKEIIKHLKNSSRRKNSAGTYNMYEYKIQINKLSDITKIAVLAEPMGESRDNIGNYEKYTKADIEDMSIERGWTGFEAIKDQDQKPTGKRSTESGVDRLWTG